MMASTSAQDVLIGLTNLQQDDNILPHFTLPVYEAFQKYESNYEQLEIQLRKYRDEIWSRDEDGRYPIHVMATIVADSITVRVANLLTDSLPTDSSQFCEMADTPDINGNTALHHATMNLKPHLVEFLLRRGCSVESVNSDLDTPLHIAVKAVKGIGSLTDADFHCVQTIWESITTVQKQRLVNLPNKSKQNPFFIAVSRNRKRIVKLFLDSRTVKLEPRNIRGSVLHFICSDFAETAKQIDIVTAILNYCTEDDPIILAKDNQGRTALHIAAKSGLPKILKLLADKNKRLLRIRDLTKRTALFYAAENGRKESGRACIEVLLNLQQYTYHDLFKHMDNQHNTAFQYICKFCPTETIEACANIISKAPIGHIESCMDSESMAKMYLDAPLAIGFLMDQSFSYHNSVTHQNGLHCDFGSIVGYTNAISLPRNHKESEFLNNSINGWSYDNQKKIVEHPLVQLFVQKKCQKLQTTINILLLIQTFWSITLVLLLVYYTNPNLYGDWVHEARFTVAIIVCTYCGISCIYELFELGVKRWSYIRNTANLFQIPRNGLLAVSTWPLFTFDPPFEPVQSLAAVGLLLSFSLILRHLRNVHKSVGFSIEILKQVVQRVVVVLVSCGLLIFGFTAAFMIQFRNPVTPTNSSMEGSLGAPMPGPMLKILVMMTGELEYSGTYDNPEEADVTGWGLLSRKLIFFAFLVGIVLSFFNQLTGIALEQIRQINDRADTSRITRKIEYIYFIESLLLALAWVDGKIWCKCCCTCSKCLLYFEKYNVAELRFPKNKKLPPTIDRVLPVCTELDKPKGFVIRFHKLEKLKPETYEKMYRLADKNFRECLNLDCKSEMWNVD